MIEFEKYQAAGNDFIIINNMNKEYDYLNDLAISVCDRHYGVGADGLIVLEQSEIGDAKMLYFNSDGSSAPMCGNGIRCFAMYLYDHKILTSPTMNIETLAGIVEVKLLINDKKIEQIRVNLGKPEYLLKDDLSKPKLTDIVICGQIFKGTVLKLKVLHTVVLINKFNTEDVLKYGPQIENYFSEKSNVNFVEVLNSNSIKVITWEKGVGLTKACGTGAAASAIIAAELKNITLPTKVIMPGGEVLVDAKRDGVYLTGTAYKVCEGIYMKWGWNK